MEGSICNNYFLVFLLKTQIKIHVYYSNNISLPAAGLWLVQLKIFKHNICCLLKHQQLALWVERCVSGHEKRTFHNQRNKTLKMLGEHVALKKKKKESKSVSNICLLSSVTHPHVWRRYYTTELIDWLRPTKNGSITVLRVLWKSKMHFGSICAGL